MVLFHDIVEVFGLMNHHGDLSVDIDLGSLHEMVSLNASEPLGVVILLEYQLLVQSRHSL